MPENTHPELDELVGKPPHWLVRWGITVFVLALALVALVAWMAPYPETISLPVQIYKDGQVYARTYIPEKYIDRVRQGQHAITRLTAFPSHSDMIDGQISSIDGKRTDSGYASTIVFPNGFAPRDRSQLQYREGYTGTATIITNRNSLLHKIIESIK